MQRRAVGGTGLKVSRLGLGLMSWGSAIDEHEASDQLRSFRDAGGTLLDTAHVYAGGASETLLGSLLGSVDRDEVVIATKAGFSLRGRERVHDGSRGGMLDALDLSLRRLGVDHVDLWQQHVPDESTPFEETLAAFDHAVATGRTRYVGISNYSGWQTAAAATWQRAVPGRTPLAATQVEYSLLNRDVEHEVLPAARALGLGVLPYSPLASGVLTGKYRGGIPSGSRGAGDASPMVERYLDDDSGAVVEAVVRAAEGLGWTPLQVALVWVRDRPGVTAPVVGARTTAQLREVLATEELILPGEITAALDDVSAA